jgi:hypothetical protein
MEEDVIRVLATAAAGVIMRAMGTAAWQATRDRWARLLGRGDGDTEAAVAQRLDESAEAVATTGPDENPHRLQTVATDLRDLLGERLSEDPGLVDAVQALLDSPAAQSTGVRQTATVWHGTSIQSGRDTTIGPR